MKNDMWKIPPPAPVAAKAKTAVQFGAVKPPTGSRILLYGTGGVGKSTLAAALPGPVAFFDLDDSLGRVDLEGLDVRPIEGVDSYAALESALQSPGWDEIKSVVIDTGTRLDDGWVPEHVLATIPADKGTVATNLESYGWGKGYQFVFDVWQGLLGQLERHMREGRHVMLICHDCTEMVPNPAGEDYLRYEPRLYAGSKGNKNSVRLRAKEWADFLFFCGYDVVAAKEKGQKAGPAKASGGERTMWMQEHPHCMAKHRGNLPDWCLIPETTEARVELWKNIL